MPQETLRTIGNLMFSLYRDLGVFILKMRKINMQKSSKNGSTRKVNWPE